MSDMTFEEGLAVATLWQEARGSDNEGRQCVAHVIRNRMAKHYTSDGTVAGTVLAPWQFSGMMNDAICIDSLRYAATDDLNLLAVWRESETLPDPTMGAVLYYSPASMSPPGAVPSWVASSELTLTLPDFLFYAAN
jgi:spore germination cell wall hydrolase CwlJ-like protein